MSSLSSSSNSVSARVQEAAAWIRRQITLEPRAGIILGTGLGSLADCIENATLIPYEDIPHFPVSTAPGLIGTPLVVTVAMLSEVITSAPGVPMISSTSSMGSGATESLCGVGGIMRRDGRRLLPVASRQQHAVIE